VQPSRVLWQQRSTSLCTTLLRSPARIRTLLYPLREAGAGGESAVLLTLNLRLRVGRARIRSRSRAPRSQCRSWRRRPCWKRTRRRTTLQGVVADELVPFEAVQTSPLAVHHVETFPRSRAQQCMRAYKRQSYEETTEKERESSRIDVPARRQTLS